MSNSVARYLESSYAGIPLFSLRRLIAFCVDPIGLKPSTRSKS